MTAMTLAPSPFDTAGVADFPSAVPLWNARPVDVAVAGEAAVPLALNLVVDRLGFNALESDWTDLFQRAGRSEQVFQSFGWLWHWCNHFCDPQDRKQQLAIVTGYRDGVLTLVCPFVVNRSGGVATLSFMGDPVSQYGDVLVADGPDMQRDLRAAFDFVLGRAKIDLVNLRKVRSDAAIAPLLQERGASLIDGQTAPYVAFEGASDYAAFEQRYAKAARKNRKRQLRRLQDVGETSFVRYTEGAAQGEAVGLALALKRDWLKQRGLVSPAVTDARTEGFFRDCVSGRGPATGVEVAAVICDGRVAATEIAIQCKDRVAVHLIAYDQQFEKTGAGALLMEDSIRRACQSGKAVLDLLAPGTAYKFDWADRSVDVGDRVLGLSTAGKLYASVYLTRMRPAAKAFIEQMPAVVRRHICGLAGAAVFLANRCGVT